MREFIDTAILTQPPTFRTNQQNTNADSIDCDVIFLNQRCHFHFQKYHLRLMARFFFQEIKYGKLMT